MLETALTSRLQAARLTVHAANGFLQAEIFQGTVRYVPFPPARFKRGTWITLDMTVAE